VAQVDPHDLLNFLLTLAGTPQVSCLIAPDADCAVCPSSLQEETKKNYRYKAELNVDKAKEEHKYCINCRD
jgi:hypothetical protein